MAALPRRADALEAGRAVGPALALRAVQARARSKALLTFRIRPDMTRRRRFAAVARVVRRGVVSAGIVAALTRRVGLAIVGPRIGRVAIKAKRITGRHRRDARIFRRRWGDHSRRSVHRCRGSGAGLRTGIYVLRGRRPRGVRGAGEVRPIRQADVVASAPEYDREQAKPEERAAPATQAAPRHPGSAPRRKRLRIRAARGFRSGIERTDGKRKGPMHDFREA